MSRTVLLLGATGLVGRELMSLLLDDPDIERLTVLSRRPTGRSSPKLVEHIVDLDRLNERPDALTVDQIFCALGTTIRAAGSQENFRRVDYDYPLLAARLGAEHGATHFLLVSAIGASSRSRVFYNRVKGEIEDRVVALGYRSVTIARPSLLLGPRQEQRRGEELAKHFGWLMPAAYKPIEARAVARALFEASRNDAPGVTILHSSEMRESWTRSK